MLEHKPIRVALVDDHQAVVEAFSLLLQLDAEFEVLGSAISTEEGERLIAQTLPDIAVLDIRFPDSDIFERLPRLREQSPATKFVLLTAHCSDLLIKRAIEVGVAGYLLKTESALLVRSALKMIHSGKAYFSAPVQDRLLWNERTQRYEVRTPSLLDSLTPEQVVILRHLAHGDSVKQTAISMDRTEKSIDSHKYRIMNKLGIHDRVELCRFAIREGLIRE